MRATTATLVAAAAALFCAATSQAATYIPSGTLSGSQEWTTAGSPYVIETTATVGEGTTLTIDPGVVVKFEEANYGELFVIGSLVADGTSTNKVTFTSYADDSAGGDTNGDGSSSGSPGDWYGIVILDSGTGDFDHAIVRYGGYGEGISSYGGLQLQNYAEATIDHSLFTDNEVGGVAVNGNATTATIQHSEFSYNGAGISSVNSTLTIENNTNVHDNSEDGLFINESDWTGAAPSITHSSFEDNGRYGVNLWVDSSTLPVGHYNNIDGNGSLQLNTLENLTGSDWTDNYWGDVLEVPCDLLHECPYPAVHEPYFLDTEGSWDGLYWEYPDPVPPSAVSSSVLYWPVEIDDEWVLLETRLDWIDDDGPSSSSFDNSGY